MAASQLDIGQSSNLAQICLTYSYNFDDQKYVDNSNILAVLAQAAIDNSKRTYNVDIKAEIKRIKEEINVAEIGYPTFWSVIRPEFNKDKINPNLHCPMNALYDLRIQEFHPTTSTLPMSYFFNTDCLEAKQLTKVAKKIETLIEKYSLELATYNHNHESDENDDYLLLRDDFDKLLADIRTAAPTGKYLPLFAQLINRAFVITPYVKNNEKNMKSKLQKNKALLLKTLYEINPNAILAIFGRVVKNDL